MTHKEYRGHSIDIEEPVDNALAGEAHFGEVRAAKPRVLIDGKPVPYQKTDTGFAIYYQPPQPTLEDAARSFLDTQREK